ncbi:MAG: histidine phosphatase family protein, partial [Parafilimonas terrae]|nr:histidine phosphatase family protein [Parafilimonas terrae]
TAAPIAARHGLSVEVDEGLNEIDCGDWTGKRFDELPGDPRWADWNRHRESASTPGGETMRAVRSRAMDAVRRHGAASGRHGAASGRHGTADPTVAVVSHSDVIKAVVCGVLGLSLDRHDAFAVDPASITTLHIWGETMRVARLNEAVGG